MELELFHSHFSATTLLVLSITFFVLTFNEILSDLETENIMEIGAECKMYAPSEKIVKFGKFGMIRFDLPPITGRPCQ